MWRGDIPRRIGRPIAVAEHWRITFPKHNNSGERLKRNRVPTLVLWFQLLLEQIELTGGQVFWNSDLNTCAQYSIDMGWIVFGDRERNLAPGLLREDIIRDGNPPPAAHLLTAYRFHFLEFKSLPPFLSQEFISS